MQTSGQSLSVGFHTTRIIVVVALFIFADAQAQTTNRWTNDVAGTWSWQTSENWSAGAPASSQTILITNANSKTIRITGVGPGSCASISNLLIRAPAGTTNTLQLDDFESPGVLAIRNSLILSNGGVFVQNAATTRVDCVALLSSFTVDGEAWLNGGVLLMTNFFANAYIGHTKTGQMTVSNAVWRPYSVSVGWMGGAQGTLTLVGGTINCASSFTIGDSSAATGTFWMAGGALYVSNSTSYVGDQGIGCATISNGIWNSGTLNIAASGGNSTLTMAGGSVNTRYGTYVGIWGPGALWINGGELNANGGLSVAQWYPSIVTISNGVLRATGLTCGYTTSGNGTINIAGGKMVINLTMSLGVFNNTSTGSVWVTGGELCVTNLQSIIGSTGTGQIIVSNALYRAAEVYVASGGNGTLTLAGSSCPMKSLRVANSLNTTGTVSLTDSTMTAVGFPYLTSHIGYGGVGQMTVSNSTWHASRIVVGFGNNARGTLTIDGGEVVANATVTYGGLMIGSTGCRSTGVVTITSGSLLVTNDTHTCELEVRSGTLTIAGGYVQCDRIIITNACANFVRTGGTFIYSGGLILSAADTDGDGIINSYEIANGLDPLDPVNATKDTDGDGLTDLQEYLAGTSPTNNASAFRITSIMTEGDDIRVTWQTAAGKTNALQRSSDVAGSYSNIFTVTNTVGVTANYLDVGGATNTPSRYYRVRVVP